MFGYIKKKKVLSIIENGRRQLLDEQNRVVLTNKEGYSEKDMIDWRDSIKKLEGGIYALECLKKHFK